MSLRFINFPDHKDPNFDPNVPFEAPNGITYVWNGYAWETKCGSGSLTCTLDGETEFIAYAAGTDLAQNQAFVDTDCIYFKGNQASFVKINDEFKIGVDTFTVAAVEVVTEGTYGSFTKVTVAEDPSGLIGKTLKIEGLCEPLGDRYLLADGDNVSGLLSWNNLMGGDNQDPFVGIKIYENRKQGNELILLAESGGSYSKGQLSTELEPTSDKHITNKKYVDEHYAKKSDLATATAALPYTIETDKALRLADIEIKNRFTGEAAPMYAGGEIYLTDNLSFFSNVRFSGLNNITTSSDAQGIIVDGAALMPKNLLSLPELT